MTYWNGNVYHGPTPTAPLDKWAHDDCLPADQLETTMLSNYNAEPFINDRGFREFPKEPHVHQKWPWHWAPAYGAPKPCYVCGEPVK